MRVRVFAGTELPHEYRAAWAELLAANPTLDSPLLRPEYTEAVARLRPEVEVAVGERDGQPPVLLPFERISGKVAMPVGGWLSDFQAVIAHPDADWDTAELLRKSELAAWNFDHLIATQQPLAEHHFDRLPSPYLDLSQGYEHFAQGRRTVKNLRRKLKQLERRVGPVRFTFRNEDTAAFATLVALKREQYVRTGARNVMAQQWVLSLLDQLRTERDEAFSGVLSTMHAGNELVALQYSLRSRGVLHVWFPVYDARFARHSPGQILLDWTARVTQEHGIHRIDLGKGPEPYKRQVMSGAVLVAEGSVDLRPAIAHFKRTCYRMRQWVLASPLHQPARMVARSAASVFPPLRRWLWMR